MDTEKRPRGRPRTGVTPKRNIRVGPIWDEAEAIACARGDGTMSKLVPKLLENYVRRHRHEMPWREATDG